MKNRGDVFAVCALLLAAFVLSAATYFADDIEYRGKVSVRTADRGLGTILSKCVTDDVDSGAAPQVLTAVFPAKAVQLGLTCRVDETIVGEGASSMKVGDGSDADRYGATIAFAAGTTVGSANYTATPIGFSASAQNITLTANAGQFDEGSITCCGHYVMFTGPAS